MKSDTRLFIFTSREFRDVCLLRALLVESLGGLRNIYNVIRITKEIEKKKRNAINHD